MATHIRKIGDVLILDGDDIHEIIESAQGMLMQGVAFEYSPRVKAFSDPRLANNLARLRDATLADDVRSILVEMFQQGYMAPEDNFDLAVGAYAALPGNGIPAQPLIQYLNRKVAEQPLITIDDSKFTQHEVLHNLIGGQMVPDASASTEQIIHESAIEAFVYARPTDVAIPQADLNEAEHNIIDIFNQPQELAIAKCNSKMKKGIAYAIEQHLIDDTPESIVNFIIEHENKLNSSQKINYILGKARPPKKAILPDIQEPPSAEYVKEDQIRQRYINANFDFSGMPLPDAIRAFLGTVFGEATNVDGHQISWMCTSFSHCFVTQNPEMFPDNQERAVNTVDIITTAANLFNAAASGMADPMGEDNARRYYSESSDFDLTEDELDLLIDVYRDIDATPLPAMVATGAGVVHEPATITMDCESSAKNLGNTISEIANRHNLTVKKTNWFGGLGAWFSGNTRLSLRDRDGNEVMKITHDNKSTQTTFELLDPEATDLSREIIEDLFMVDNNNIFPGTMSISGSQSAVTNTCAALANITVEKADGTRKTCQMTQNIAHPATTAEPEVVPEPAPTPVEPAAAIFGSELNDSVTSSMADTVEPPVSVNLNAEQAQRTHIPGLIHNQIIRKKVKNALSGLVDLDIRSVNNHPLMQSKPDEAIQMRITNEEINMEEYNEDAHHALQVTIHTLLMEHGPELPLDIETAPENQQKVSQMIEETRAAIRAERALDTPTDDLDIGRPSSRHTPRRS